MNGPLRIAVYGPESTGKTRLAETLARHFRAPLVAEYAREFWDRHGAITLADIPAIAREQWRREDAAAERAERLIICDTDALTTVLWSDWLYGECPEEIRREADRRARQYAHYLLLDIDVPFVADPQRCFPKPEQRVEGMKRWRTALEKRKLPHVLIGGPWESRTAAAIKTVRALLDR